MRDSFDSLFFSVEITELCEYPFYSLSTQVQPKEEEEERARDWSEKDAFFFIIIFISTSPIFIFNFIRRTKLFWVFFREKLRQKSILSILG